MSVRDPKRRDGAAHGTVVPLHGRTDGDEQSRPVESRREAAPRRPLIIERPDLQTMTQRYGYMSFTFFAWFAWLYLVVPLFSLLAWAAGLNLIYEAMVQDLLTAELFHMLKVYGSGAAAFSGAYILWAVTSYLRWRNVERRQAASPVDDAKLANSHLLQLHELHALRVAQRLVLSPEMLEQMFDPQTENVVFDDPEPRLDKLG